MPQTWLWDPRGTDEADVTTPSPAGSSGPTNLVIVKGTGGTVKFDTAFPLFGASNCRVSPGTAAATEPTWTGMTLSACYARFYMRLSATPASGQRFMQGWCAGSQSLMGFDITTANKLATKYGTSSATLGTLNTSIPVGQWIRVELSMTSSSGMPTIMFQTFHSPHSITATDTLMTMLAMGMGSTAVNAFRLPCRYQYNGVPQIWLDGIALSDTAMPSPLPDPSLSANPYLGEFFPFLAAG